MTENNKKRILYAEDEEPVRRLMNEFLSRRFPDFLTITVEDGNRLNEELERISTEEVHNVAVVLTDNTMPGYFGIELIRKYASRKGMPHFVLYSGDSYLSEDPVFKDGLATFVCKPNFSELFATMSELLSVR